MIRRIGLLILGLALCGAAASSRSAEPWSPDPWLADLAQMHGAIEAKYANLDWLTHERGVDLDALFADSAVRLRRAGSDADARAVFDRIVSKIDDGHVELEWPPVASVGRASAAAKPDLCTDMGFDARQETPGIGPALPGYQTIAEGSPFGAGLIDVEGTKLGVLRIGVFQPQGSPALCHAATQALGIAEDKPCDDACQDRVTDWAYERLTALLEDRLRALKAAGAEVLLIDISDNGGGTEWVEVAMRMLSTKQLISERTGFVRGSHWSQHWSDLAQQLHKAARYAGPADKARLAVWQDEAAAAQRDADLVCPGTTGCARIGRMGFATGLIGSAQAGAFAGKPWGSLVFSPAQYVYRDGVWTGPLLVLVDQETWSAAEEFAATLQDNHTATIIGARTGGAGCGRTDGGTPTTLAHSGAILGVPDCVRFRADGSNEVRGIIPDRLIAIRANDGAAFSAALVRAALPGAITEAMRQP